MPPDSTTDIRAALTAALSLFLPISCAGCDEPDVPLCAQCREMLRPRVIARDVEGLVVRSGVEFDGAAARVLRACKEDGRTSLARALAPALRSAVEEVLAHADVDAGPVIVVPVPTSNAAMRRRGYRVAELIARRAGVHPHRLLAATGRTADQRGLGRLARADNVAGSMHAWGVAERAVLIVDDVVTTGSTLVEAARALRAGGAHVVGAATVASTPRKGFVTVTRT